MRILRAALRWSAYPAMTGGAVLFCRWALERGWPVWAIGVAVVVGSCVLVEGLERVIPYSRRWSRGRGDLRTDVWHTAISNRAFDLGTFAAISALAPAGAALSSWLGVQLWPDDLPLAVQAALVLVLFELPWYWLHRLGHEWPLAWRVHSVHHSVPRMYWWNVARNHPIDNLVSAFVSIAPLILLGAGDAPLAFAAAFSGAHSMLQHSNADLRTGFLDVFFTTPRVHRFHHSRDRAQADANYGPTVTIWDWVFGTRRFFPDEVPPEDVGLTGDPKSYPADFAGQLRAPFDAKLWRP